jgi:hypothetical protein
MFDAANAQLTQNATYRLIPAQIAVIYAALGSGWGAGCI